MDGKCQPKPTREAGFILLSYLVDRHCEFFVAVDLIKKANACIQQLRNYKLGGYKTRFDDKREGRRFY